jgi:hypothetical protein
VCAAEKDAHHGKSGGWISQNRSDIVLKIKKIPILMFAMEKG